MSVRGVLLRLLPLLVCGCSLNPVPEDPGVSGNFEQGGVNPTMPPNAGAPGMGGVNNDGTTVDPGVTGEPTPGAGLAPTTGSPSEPSLPPSGSSSASPPADSSPGAPPTSTAPVPTPPASEAPPAQTTTPPLTGSDDAASDSGLDDAGAESELSDAAVYGTLDAVDGGNEQNSDAGVEGAR